MEPAEFRGSFLYDLLLPKVEKIGLLVTIVGLLFAWMHIGRFEVLLIVGLQTLAITCFLRAFEPLALEPTDELNFPSQYFSDHNLPIESQVPRRLLTDVLAPKVLNIAGACVIVGILFKLEFWKGADLQLLVGEIPLVLFVFLLALQQQIDRRALLIAILGGLMLLVSSETLMRQLHSDDPQLVELMVYQLHHPHDRAANEALRTYLHQKRTRR